MKKALLRTAVVACFAGLFLQSSFAGSSSDIKLGLHLNNWMFTQMLGIDTGYQKELKYTGNPCLDCAAYFCCNEAPDPTVWQYDFTLTASYEEATYNIFGGPDNILRTKQLALSGLIEKGRFSGS